MPHLRWLWIIVPLILVYTLLILWPYIASCTYDLHSLAASYNTLPLAPRRSKNEQTFISLTTLPSRIKFLSATLKSLLRQTHRVDQIVLHLPRYCAREQCAYKLTEEIISLQNYSWFRVNWIETDYGPATKLLPMLHDIVIKNEEDCIIVCDDDVIYGPHLVANLCQAAVRFPDYAISILGWTPGPSLSTKWSGVTVKAKFVSIAQGFAGYLVKPKFLVHSAILDYSNTPKECKITDDIWISSHLALHNVKILRLPFSFRTIPWPSKSSRINAIHLRENAKTHEADKVTLNYFANTYGLFKH